MAEIKPPQGASTSSIKLDVNVEVEVEGRVTRHLPDGTEVEGSPSQEFVRIEEDRLLEGDWLINPMTNETHRVVRVVGVGVGLIAITTKDGQVAVKWSDVIENLLLVVQV